MIKYIFHTLLKRIFLLYISGVIFLFYLSSSSFAQGMSSDNYQIQGGNLNITSGNKSSENYGLSDVVGQNASGIFSTDGYIIQAGFLNSVIASAFNLSVSPILIDFATLTPNMPVEKNVQITVSTAEAPGYTLTVAANSPLSTTAGAEIPNTDCNNSDMETKCSPYESAPWTGNTIPGLGYRLIGKNIPQDFSSPDYYRPFASLSTGEEPIIIMQSQQTKITDSAIMTLKLIIDQNQAVGLYHNVLKFTAVAGI